MKTRFRQWNWKEMPWIIIGTILMFIAMAHVNKYVPWPLMVQ